MNNSNTPENLVFHVNKYLFPAYELTIGDIPQKYIRAGKSAKFVELRKTSSDEIYTDWNYDDFDVNTLTSDCYRKFGVDRDYEPILRDEFEDITQKITLALNNLIQ